jgi:DNA repair exonuclease SbcCD nuclease subunit
MKILFITDTHIGSRSGSNTFRQLFREYYRDVLFPYIKENDIDEVFHLGDFFDNRSSLSLADIDYVMNEFIPLIEDAGVTFRIIVGNHDTHFKNTNSINSLSIFKSCEYVRIIEDKLEVFDTGDVEFVMCPWINVENHDQLLDDVKFYADKKHILCGHFEISGALMYKNSIPCDGGLDAKLFKDFKRVLSGHFHHPSIYSNVQYIGALFHYNWEDAGDVRGFTVYDSDTDQFEFIENEYCLFTAVNYHDTKDKTDEQFNNLFNSQFVRVYVNEEYDKLEFKEFKQRVEKCNPLQLDIIDNTIFDIQLTEEEQTSNESVVKEPIEYAKRFSQDQDVLSVFEDVYNQVLNNRKDVA